MAKVGLDSAGAKLLQRKEVYKGGGMLPPGGSEVHC